MGIGRISIGCALLGVVTTAAPAQVPTRLTLEEAVRAAMIHSPRLERARAAVEEAAGGVREAHAPRVPGVLLEGTAFRFAEPMIVAPLHGIDPARPPRFDETLVQGSLGMGYTLFDGGERGGRLRQARESEAAGRSQVRGAEQEVVAGTVQAYAEVLSAGDVLVAEERRITALAAEAERVRRLLGEGRAARVEELRVLAAMARARADSSEAAARLEIAEAALSRVTGLPRGRTRAHSLRPVILVDRRIPDRQAAQEAAERSSPALEAATRRVAAAEAGVAAARAGWWPTVRLEGRAVSYGAGEGDFTTEWQAGLRLTYPLFTGGSRRGAIEKARGGARGAAADRRELVDALEAEIDVVLARTSEARRRVEALEAAVAHQTEVVRTEALALAEGAGVQSDYLRAEADLAAVQATLSATRVTEIVARVDLARLTGRLDPESLRAIVEER